MKLLAWMVGCAALASGIDAPSDAKEPISRFEGSWSVWLCPAGVAQSADNCARFELYIYESNGELCGAHAFASAGASRVDEGSAPSIVGKVAGYSADVAITSGRADPPVTLHARLTRSGTRLRWKRLDAPLGDYLIPEDVWLSRNKGPLFSSDFAYELRKACTK